MVVVGKCLIIRFDSSGFTANTLTIPKGHSGISRGHNYPTTNVIVKFISSNIRLHRQVIIIEYPARENQYFDYFTNLDIVLGSLIQSLFRTELKSFSKVI